MTSTTILSKDAPVIKSLAVSASAVTQVAQAEPAADVANALGALPPPNKQVIILRKDLNMRKGKMVAQGAHAALAVFMQKIMFLSEDDGTLVASFPVSEVEHAWLTGNFRKIVLGATSEAELLSLFEQAKSAGLPCSLIKDNGLTEFKNVQTYTAIAIGPALDELIDPICGPGRLDPL